MRERRSGPKKNDQDWINAQKQRKPRWWLESQYLQTRSVKPQSCAWLCGVPRPAEAVSPSAESYSVTCEIIKPSEGESVGQYPEYILLLLRLFLIMTKGKGPKKIVKALKKVLKKTKKKGQKKYPSGKIRGRGDFFSDAWNGVKKFGKNVLGQGIHKGIDWLSDRAHSAIKSVVGHGDYKMSGSPVVYNSMLADSAVVPKFSNSGNNNIIQHREPLGKVFSSVAFQRNTITLNPGLTVFPWLSEIAHAFQRYKFHGAIVEFVSSVSPLSADASGRVVLSTRYDLSSAAPQSVQEAEIAFGSVPARPMDNMAMPIECKASMNAVNALNVRYGDLPAGANAQFFDHCLVDVCNEGQTTTGSTLLGEIYLTFEIEMMMPIAEHLTNATIQSFAAYAPITTAAPYGSTWTKRSGQMIPVLLTATAGSLVVDFDSVQPLPIGSTWSVQVVTRLIAGKGVTAGNAFTLAADLGAYSLYKTSAGADDHQVGTSVATVTAVTEASMIMFTVLSQTTNQSILINAATYDAAATGYMTLIVTPITSGLSEARMRARYPGLYALQDSMDRKYGQILAQATAAAKETRDDEDKESEVSEAQSEQKDDDRDTVIQLMKARVAANSREIDELQRRIDAALDGGEAKSTESTVVVPPGIVKVKL
jgi:hypothetical protein